MTLLDPDDPRPPYRQVASSLRAAILTKKFQPGDRLPSQGELAARYGVARMTVQQSLRVLREEGLIVSRQGSGVFVRERTERPVGLRPRVDAAFGHNEVLIDFAGYTAGTLNEAIAEPVDKIRHGRLTPAAVHLRLLLADLSRPIALPAKAGPDAGDDPQVRAQMARGADRDALGIAESIEELRDLGLVQKASVQIRVHSSAPLFKVFLLNNRELFLGLYNVVEHGVKIGGKTVKIHEPIGNDAVLFHHTADADADSPGSRYVSETAKWFDNLWNTLGRPCQPA
jgi:DNA-binding transcriptional regulator YhcF (GntR family)